MAALDDSIDSLHDAEVVRDILLNLPYVKSDVQSDQTIVVARPTCRVLHADIVRRKIDHSRELHVSAVLRTVLLFITNPTRGPARCLAGGAG